MESSRKNLQSHRKKEDDDISIENFDEAVAKGEEDLTHLKHFWGGIKRVIKANQPRDLSEKYYDIQGYLTEKVLLPTLSNLLIADQFFEIEKFFLPSMGNSARQQMENNVGFTIICFNCIFCSSGILYHWYECSNGGCIR